MLAVYAPSGNSAGPMGGRGVMLVVAKKGIVSCGKY